jgi:hypothetical protein
VGGRGPALRRLVCTGGREVLARGPAAGPREYVDWFIDANCLKRAEDEERLREGMRAAGLLA